MRARRFALVTTVCVLIAGAVLAITTSVYDSKVHVGKRYPSERLVSFDEIDHADWNRLLSKYVDADGLVDYASWHDSSVDIAILDAYLDSLGQADPQVDAARESRLAFWINAYNALTIKGILREYPTDSIRNHTAKIGGYNIWRDLLLAVGDKSYSLDGIEHKILRKMGEPRIHFAIVCASISCPRLRNEAYLPARIESQLADNTRDFFSRKQNFHVDDPGVQGGQRTVYVSPILKWFGGDFGGSAKQGLNSLSEYLPNDVSRELIEYGDYSVGYIDYDWSLNSQ